MRNLSDNKLFLFFILMFSKTLTVTSGLPEGTGKPIAIIPPIASPTTTTITTSTGTILSIDCFRNAVESAKSPGEFLVEVTIKKDNLGGFTKFIETLPVGFSATVIEAQGANATVSFVDQKIIFVWNTLPSQAEFKISYKINIAPNISGEKIIEGVFSFIENERIMKFVLPQTSVNIIAPVITQPIAVAQKPTTPIVAPKPPTVDYYQINKSKETKGTKKLAAGNINYKVQFLALYQPNIQVPLVLDSIINEPIETTLTQGFMQYTIGPFNSFEEVVKHKDEMVLKGYPGSFIKAYLHKRRITIKDARAMQEGK